MSNWLIEADFKNYWDRFKAKKSIWFVAFIFFFGAISLLWSDNFDYGFRDIRMKLPLIAIPLAMATSEPLEKRFFNFILFVFLGMLAYTTIYNYVSFHYFEHEGHDVRKMSLFISHVRLSTLLVLGIFISIYCVIQKIGGRILISSLIPWFVFYLLKSQVLNGYLLLGIITICSIIYALRNISNIRYRLLAGFVFASIIIVSFAMLLQQLSTFASVEEINDELLGDKTANGNAYYHNFENKHTENGHYIWINMNQQELESEWNERSEIAYDSLDRRGQPMFGTLMRYLTSKGEKKDSVAVWALSDDEVHFIEEGNCSVMINSGYKARLQSFMYEYQMYKDGGDPNGHSMLQRIEHLGTALMILKEKWLFGVGSGDLNDTFQEAYTKNNSRLLKENRWRAHNQFLSIWISLGLIGFIVFVLMLIQPIIENDRRDYFMIIVTITLFFSCMFQDVLETQAGITIFALFYSLSAYRKPDDSIQ